MKGVILAGGSGSRLLPLTTVVNKHLLPVYDKPMIMYPIQTLVNAGIREVLLVTGGNHSGGFLQLLGNGRKLGLNELHYAYQEGVGGIADALSLARDFANGDKIVVMLGDNIIEKHIRKQVGLFSTQESGAQLVLKGVDHPERFGVAELDHPDGGIIRIVEKPVEARSNLAVTGIYMYDSAVFEYIDAIKPSDRGELEITDVNNLYIQNTEVPCHYSILDGWWTDAGTFESLHKASCLVAGGGANKVMPVPQMENKIMKYVKGVLLMLVLMVLLVGSVRGCTSTYWLRRHDACIKELVARIVSIEQRMEE